MADSRKPKKPGDKKPPSGGPNPNKPGTGSGSGPFPWSNTPKPGNPPKANPRPGFAWKWNGQAWIETRLTKEERPTQTLPEGYEWVWDDATGWGFRQTPTDPVDPVDPTDPADPVDPVNPTEPPGPDSQTLATRANAREYLKGLFKQFGFSDEDSLKLMGDVEGWIQAGLADAGTDAVLMKFRDTNIYKTRFAGMAELIGRGQAITEAEYIGLESAYRSVMSNYGLPTTYYDKPEDYARLIGAGLSVKEVEERVVAAKQAMNPLVSQELKQYYDITDGDLTAYMLGLTDEKGLQLASARNQEQIRTGARAAQIGAAGERAGFSMNRALSERLGGTSLGQTQDPFQMETMSRLEGTFDQARRVADRETTLAGIDREAFNQTDTLDAAFGDRQKQLASEKRAKRERARFAGSSGASAGSLAVERNM